MALHAGITALAVPRVPEAGRVLAISLFVLEVPVELMIIQYMLAGDSGISIAALFAKSNPFFLRAFAMSVFILIPATPFVFIMLLGNAARGIICLAVVAFVFLLWYLSLQLFIVFPALVDRNRNAWDTLRYSWKKTRGKVWEVFSIVFIANLVLILVEFPVMAFAGYLEVFHESNAAAQCAGRMLSDAVSLLVLPYSVFIAMVIYHYLSSPPKNTDSEEEIQLVE
ncbi:MAG: glycerophosphoryl diester phosphodiesterase membrane domain-containing protein [Anaerolineales bacterium]|nr:glycerophosphoryl diester phosphodiesterase membrane domain-containing protein [Anaerolineales bacterium]